MSTLLHRADKARRTESFDALLCVRNMAADWLGGLEPYEDWKLKKKARAEQRRKQPPPRRFVAPSATQLYAIRTAVMSMYDEDAPGMSGGEVSILLYTNYTILC